VYEQAVVVLDSHGQLRKPVFTAENTRAGTDANGALLSEQRYLPFGEVRMDVGTITQTDFGYTFQRDLDAQGATYEIGLVDYKARFYDPYITHLTQPDTIIPDTKNPQAWNRYSYALNNPIRYNDPTGHCIWDGCIIEIMIAAAVIGAAVGYGVQVYNNYHEYGETGVQAWTDVEAKPILDLAITAPVLPLVAPEVLSTGGYGMWSAGQAIGSTGLAPKLADGLSNAGASTFAASSSLNSFLYGPPSSVPTLAIDSRRMPNIANNIQNAQDNGAPTVLTRTTNSDLIASNRAAACRGFCGVGSPDEYPFASTYQGGSGAFVTGVPLQEQHIQGWTLMQFFKTFGIQDGDPFRVIVDWVSKPK
jgi:RHS repeat-associated protein